MRTVAFAAFFSLILLIVPPLIFADSTVSDLAYKTIITTDFVSGTNITAHIVYLNISYYSKLNGNPQPGLIGIEPGGIDPEYEPTTEQRNITFHFLNGSPIYFTLDGFNVSSDGASENCNPAISDINGEVRCRVDYFKNLSGQFQSIRNKTSCGTLKMEFRGMWRGPVQYRPSSSSIILCPDGNRALSAFGPALYLALGTPSNMLFCFPALLVLGLLVASMYYSGRDPLSLFDLTTPRLPKAKPSRISSGSTTMAIRSAVAKYMEAKNKAKQDTRRLLRDVMRVNGKSAADKRNAKRELKKIFKDLENDLNKMRIGKEGVSYFDNDRILEHKKAMQDLFEKHGLKSLAGKNKLYRRYSELSTALMDLYTFSEHGMRAMQSARGPSKGPIYRNVGNVVQYLTGKAEKLEKGVEKIPGYRKFAHLPVLGIPAGVLSVPHKLLDVWAQRRSAKGWLHHIRRATGGQIVSYALTKDNPDSPIRQDRALGKLVRKSLYDGDKLNRFGEFMQSFYAWNYKDYVARHSVNNLQLGPQKDTVEYYRWAAAQALTHDPSFVWGLLRSEADPEATLNRMIKNATGAQLGKLMQIKAELHALGPEPTFADMLRVHGAIASLAKVAHDADREALMEHVRMMKAFSDFQAKTRKNQNEAFTTDMVSALLEAKYKGKKPAELAAMRKALAEMREIEGEIRRVFCVANIDGSRNLDDFRFEHLRTFAQQASDEVRKEMQRTNKAAYDAFVSSLKLGNRKISDAEILERFDIAYRDDISKRLNQKVRALFTGVESGNPVIELMDANGQHFLFDMAYKKDVKDKKTGLGASVGDEEFKKVIQVKINEHVQKNLQEAADDKGQIDMGKGLLGRFTKKLDDLNASLTKIAGEDAPYLGFGKDASSAIMLHHFNKIGSALDSDAGVKAHFAGKTDPTEQKALEEAIKQLKTVKNMMALEELFSRGTQRKDTVAALTEALMAASEGTRKAVCKSLVVVGANENEAAVMGRLSGQLDRIIQNRKDLLSAISIMPADRRQFVCGKLNLAASASDLEILDRLHLLEARSVGLIPFMKKVDSGSDKRQMKKILSALGADQGVLERTSIADFIMSNSLKKTEVELEKWGGEMLRTSKILSGDRSAWKSSKGARLEFVGGAELEEAIEYAAMRKLLLYTQYQGADSQHIETMLYVTRRLNRALGFAISKGLGSNVADNMLGGFNDLYENNLKAYAMQRAMFKNLVTQGGKMYDADFAKLVNGSDAFTPEAYRQLLSRGIKVRDARYMPYMASSDNVGFIPLLEFDQKVLDRQKKGLILKPGKADERDYGDLLSRVRASDFASEIHGVFAVRKLPSGHLDRIDPARITEVQTLLDASKFNPQQRDAFAKVLAGVLAPKEGSKPVFKFMQATDFVENHAKGFEKGVHKATAAVASFVYPIFSENMGQLRTWYAAQARARHALYAINNMSGDWMKGGGDLLNATNYVHRKGLILEDELAKIDANRGLKDQEQNTSSKLNALVEMMQKGDKLSSFKRRTYAKMEEGAAEQQSAWYAASLELKALQKMRADGQLGHLTNAQFGAMVSQLKTEAKNREAAFKEARKDAEVFRKSVIELTGSHSNTYYGSSRNLFTMLGVPGGRIGAYEYEAGLTIEFFMTIESTAMRDAAVNRGGRYAAEYWEKMNMNTGQGIYENPRWWATSMYEHQMVPFMAITHFVHRAFLPLATGFYRKQAGLTSFLQRTELETDYGRQRGGFIAAMGSFLGLRRGMNDLMGAQMQEFVDYSGAGTLMAALRQGSKIRQTSDGSYYSEPAAYAKWLKKIGVESSHVGADTQLRSQNRIHDQIGDSEAWKENPVIPTGSTTSRLWDVASKWVDENEKYKFATSEAEREASDKRLKEYERWLNPYMNDFVDRRPMANRESVAGNFFNKDGSRDRFMEIFMNDHQGTWRRIIPGMTEIGPFSGTILSPEVTNYYDRAKDNSRLGAMRNMYTYKYKDDAYDGEGGFVLTDNFSTHRDAMRYAYRLETSALTQLVKMQSGVMQYEMFAPYATGIMNSVASFASYFGVKDVYERYHEKRRRVKLETPEIDYVNTALQQAGVRRAGYSNALDILRYDVSVKRSNWDEMQANSQNKGKISKFAEFLTFRGEQTLERLRREGMEERAFRENLAEVLGQIELKRAA